MTEQKKDEAVDSAAVTELSAALEKLVEEDKVDDKALAEIDKVVSNLNEKTRARIMDLPVIQKLVEASAAAGSGEPGSYVPNGMFTRKIPYNKKDIIAKWGLAETFTAPETIVVVVPGGWQYRLNQGVTYDQPLDTPMEQIPLDHGYKLPNIVLGILADRARDLRTNRRETELKSFGQGVKFLQTGWAGKDMEVAAAKAAPHPEPTDQ